MSTTRVFQVRHFSVAAVFAVLMFPLLALGSTAGTPGNSCQPGFGGTSVFQDDYGMGNSLTGSTVSYICPVIMGQYSISVISAGLRYADVTSTNTFACYMFHSDYNGGQWWSRTKYTCSTYGGCNDSTTSYTGTNSLSWSGADLPHGGSFTLYFNDNAGFRCDVPPATSGSWSGRSWIRSSYVSW